MAENEQSAPAEIDIDSLDDKAFDELKGKMRAEQPVEAPAETNKAPPATQAKDADKAAPDANGGDVDEDGEPKQEFVPHKKFHQANERRKRAEAEAETMRLNYAKLMDRTTQLLQRDVAPAQQEQPREVPKFGDNPVEVGEWTRDEVLAIRAEQKREAEQRQQQTAEAQQWQTIISTANQQFAEAEKADPAVRDAYNSLKQSYAAELKALGHTPQSAEQQLANIEAQGIRYALQNNIPIADYVVNLASARGWQKKAPVVDPGKTDAEKITEREQTRLASLTLGKAGGAVVNTGIITPEQLLDMSDDDFAAYKKKHGSVAHAFAQAS